MLYTWALEIQWRKFHLINWDSIVSRRYQDELSMLLLKIMTWEITLWSFSLHKLINYRNPVAPFTLCLKIIQCWVETVETGKGILVSRSNKIRVSSGESRRIYSGHAPLSIYAYGMSLGMWWLFPSTWCSIFNWRLLEHFCSLGQ